MAEDTRSVTKLTYETIASCVVGLSPSGTAVVDMSVMFDSIVILIGVFF